MTAPLIIDEAACREILRHVTHMTVAIFDMDLRYVFAEGEAMRINGHMPPDVVGKLVGELSASHGEVRPHCERAINEGRDVVLDLALPGCDYELHISPFRRDGEVVGGIVVSYPHAKRDITRELSAERKMRIRTALREIETQIDETELSAKSPLPAPARIPGF